MSNGVDTALAERMRKLVEQRGSENLPEGFLEAAERFNAAVEGFFSDPPTHTVKQFVGAFARARRLWCEATGESLI